MSISLPRPGAALLFVSLGMAACSGGGPSTPAAPTTGRVPVPAAAEEVEASSTTGIAMPESNQAAKPAGFDARFRVSPPPDLDGVIHGDTPLSVTFDVCGSTPGAGQPLTYLLDWNHDGIADVASQGEECQRTHKFRSGFPGTGDVSFRPTVCVVSGNPNPKAQDPNAYFSCRTYRIAVPEAAACTHSLCDGGKRLQSTCDACVAEICKVDSYCCNIGWDGICIDEVESVCNKNSCGK